MKYIVFWVSGKRDGETLATFCNESEAVRFANDFFVKNENAFDPVCGGVAIADENGNIIEY